MDFHLDLCIILLVVCSKGVSLTLTLVSSCSLLPHSKQIERRVAAESFGEALAFAFIHGF